MTALRVEIDGEVIINEAMVSYLVNKNGVELCAPSCNNNVFGVEPFQDYFYFRSISPEGDNAEYNTLYIVNQRLSPKGGFILFSKTQETILSDEFAKSPVYCFYGFLQEGKALSYSLELVEGPEL
ncbi:MAG: hypothetical protein P9L98_05215 [Candidatus Kaelpia imicola]|nr:hypothetical protein [Candidatus Kaelpia imicola]